MRVVRSDRVGKHKSAHAHAHAHADQPMAVVPEPINDGERLSLVADDPEDLWYLAAVIRPKDFLRAQTTRNITLHEGRPAERITLHLTICVTAISYIESDTLLSVKGTVAVENPHIALGRFHTIHLTAASPFSLWKPTGFDALDLRLLRTACTPDRPENLRAVVMQDDVAHVCIVTPNRIVLRARITSRLRGKRALAKPSSSQATRATAAFFHDILAAVVAAFDALDTQPLLLASPGFTADDFRKYCVATAASLPGKFPSLAAATKKMHVAHTASGHVHGLSQALKSGTVAHATAGPVAAAIDKLTAHIRADDGWAVYGAALVRKAVAMGAVTRGATLFVASSVFFEADVAARMAVNDLTREVQAAGAEIIYAPAGEQDALHLLGGMAAILAFPVVNMDDDEEDAEDEADVVLERAIEGMVV